MIVSFGCCSGLQQKEKGELALSEKKKLFDLKPISQENFDKLYPRRYYYHDVIDEFLSGNDDVMELIVHKHIKPLSVYQSLKALAKRLGYPFLVRRRENRIFLLKRKPTEEG